MTTLERVRAWADMSISMDVTTMILRSEGVSDLEIAAAYDTMAADERYRTEVDRNRNATIVRV